MEDNFRIRPVYYWKWLVKPVWAAYFGDILDEIDTDDFPVVTKRKTVKFGKAKFVLTSNYAWVAKAYEYDTRRSLILAGSGWASGNYLYAYEMNPVKGTIPYGWVYEA